MGAPDYWHRARGSPEETKVLFRGGGAAGGNSAQAL